MSETISMSVPPAVPAATMMLLRDGASGLEVFMVKRSYQIDFISGALVFPGGKVEPGDSADDLTSYMSGADAWPRPMWVLAVAGIREAFEESGILLARNVQTNEYVSADRLKALAPYRIALERREITLAQMLEREGLKLALDQPVWFAHWITPAFAPKRFDTYFFLARSPIGHEGAHDGRESVDSVWITPEAAIADPRWTVIFPTEMNLRKLAQRRNVSEALDAARASCPLPVTPWIDKGDDENLLRIRTDAGYPITSARFEGFPNPR